MVKGRTEVIPSPLKQLLAKIAARPVSHFASASRRESGCASNSGLDIYLVATAAAIGAVVGDNLGYLIGNRYGYPLLQRYGRHIGLTSNGCKSWRIWNDRGRSRIRSARRQAKLVGGLRANLCMRGETVTL